MPTYELLFIHQMDTGDQSLSKGDAFRYGGDIWRVEVVEPGDPDERVYLGLWPNEEPYPQMIKGESAL